MLRLHIPMNTALKPSALALAAFVALAGCTPTIDQRGNLPNPEQLQMIKAGKSTRDDVLSALGTPSTTMTYGGETWHYISARTETKAFFAPEFTDRQVVSIVFDRNGVVRDVSAKGMADGQDVQSVERVTPTAGKEMSILEQLLGNVGRFSKDPSEK